MANDLNDACAHCLYKITNLVNNKCYIGVSKNPKQRKKQHLTSRRKNKNAHLFASVQKYGVENFSFDILCIGSEDYIYDLEKKAISLYNSIENGYNHREGGKGGSGHKINSRSDDYSCYVSGFWFPNKRTACEKLNITNANVFYQRKKNGTLGDTTLKVKGTVSGHPVYYKGFWFPNVDIAATTLNKTREGILQSVKKGKIEQDGRLNSPHPKRVLSINGETFQSFKEASLGLGISEYTLKSRFYMGTDNHSYEYIKGH